MMKKLVLLLFIFLVSCSSIVGMQVVEAPNLDQESSEESSEESCPIQVEESQVEESFDKELLDCGEEKEYGPAFETFSYDSSSLAERVVALQKAKNRARIKVRLFCKRKHACMNDCVPDVINLRFYETPPTVKPELASEIPDELIPAAIEEIEKWVRENDMEEELIPVLDLLPKEQILDLYWDIFRANKVEFFFTCGCVTKEESEKILDDIVDQLLEEESLCGNGFVNSGEDCEPPNTYEIRERLAKGGGTEVVLTICDNVCDLKERVISSEKFREKEEELMNFFKEQGIVEGKIETR